MHYENCNSCKCYKSAYGNCPNGYIKISDNEGSCLGPHYGLCTDGKSHIMKKWWNENGHVKPIEECETLPCYKATDFNVTLDKLLNICKEINKNTM